LPEGARKERRDLVTLFLRQTGYRTSRWTRVGRAFLLAAVLIGVLLSALWWDEIQTLVQGWRSG